MPALARKCPSEARKVAGRRLRPALRIGVALVDVHQQPAQRSHVLVVVSDDVDERAGLPEPEVVEVPAGDLPAGNVAMPAEPEELRFHRS